MTPSLELGSLGDSWVGQSSQKFRHMFCHKASSSRFVFKTSPRAGEGRTHLCTLYSSREGLIFTLTENLKTQTKTI